MNTPAFPTPSVVNHFGETMIAAGDGMSLRQYTAIKAMQGMCSSERWPADADFQEIARRAWLSADTLLASEPPPMRRDPLR